MSGLVLPACAKYCFEVGEGLTQAVQSCYRSSGPCRLECLGTSKIAFGWTWVLGLGLVLPAYGKYCFEVGTVLTEADCIQAVQSARLSLFVACVSVTFMLNCLVR